MQAIELKSIPEKPTENELHLYPDFLIGCLLKAGIGRIETDLAQQRVGEVDFVLTPQATGVPSTVASVSRECFRSVLARIGGRFSSELLYGGHALFCCDFERDGKILVHRFSLFICNYQNTAFWMKLYLYGIGGVPNGV